MNLKEKIRKILRREFSGQAHWKGFTKWWLSAEGFDYTSNPNLVKYVDGRGDGGIDAVALPPDEIMQDAIFAIQSKYFSTTPSLGNLNRFIIAARAIRGNHADFLAWLQTCRADLHDLYDSLHNRQERCRFVIVAPCTFPRWMRRRFEREEIEVCAIDELQSLHRTYVSGQTPRLPEMVLRYNSRPKFIARAGDVTVSVFTVKVAEFARAFRTHKNLLFSGNVRYALRGSTPSRVREGIGDTLERSPDEFVYSHNGITIVGYRAHSRYGKIKIRHPSIVNGAQTVSFLGNPEMFLAATNSPALVMVKLVLIEDEEGHGGIETNVAFRSNNQNKVDPSDLMVDQPELVSLQRFLRSHKISLERKRGEPSIYNTEIKITKERLVQLLLATKDEHGAAEAKKKQELFQNGTAKRLFEQYNRPNQRLLAVRWIRTNEVLGNILSDFRIKSRKRRAQFAQFAALTVFSKVCRSLGINQVVMRANSAWAERKDVFEEFVCRSLKAIISKLLGYSGRRTRNEAAFYKSEANLKNAIRYARIHARPKVRGYFNQVF